MCTVEESRHIHVLETLDQASLTFRNGLAVPQNGNDFVDIVDCQQEALEDMGTLLCLFQIELGTVGDDFHLKFQVFLQHLLQAQSLGLTAHQRQHIDADGILQLGIGKQLVQHDLLIGIFFQFDNDPHALTAGFVLNVGNALDPLILCQIGNGLHQTGLVHHVRNFRHDDRLPSANLFEMSLSAERQLALTGGIRRTDTAFAHENAAGGEVRSLHTGHQFVHGAVRIFHQHVNAVNDLAQIMGRDIGCHTDCDTHRAVYQNVRETGGEYFRFFQAVVIVGDKGHRFLVNVCQHFQGNLGHSGFGITVSSRRVAVYGTEVTLTVYQHIPH